MTARASHVGLCVSDLEAALRFWCDGLGFERAERYDLTSGDLPGLDRALEVPGPVRLTSQMVKTPGLALELLAYAEPSVEGAPGPARNRLGLTHVSLWVDDVDREAARLAGFGGTVLAGTRSNLGVEVVFVADPDGNRVELMAPPA